MSARYLNDRSIQAPLVALPVGAYGSPMTRSVATLLIAVICLTGCLDRAEVERTLGPERPGNTYPELLPVDALLSLEPADPEETAALIKELRDRAKALRRRARRSTASAADADLLEERANALRARAAGQPG